MKNAQNRDYGQIWTDLDRFPAILAFIPIIGKMTFLVKTGSVMTFVMKYDSSCTDHMSHRFDYCRWEAMRDADLTIETKIEK